jgi:hypothetical protein
MTRIFKYMLLAILIVTALACGVISNPLSNAQGLASTAEAMASAMPISSEFPGLASTAEALASAIPSGIPDVSQYMNPQGTPVTDWNGIPIMTQASAGQEFNANTYSFRVSGVSETDVESFYKDKLPAAGWTAPFSAQGGTEGGFMLFTKNSAVLSITVTKSDQDLVVLLTTTGSP